MVGCVSFCATMSTNNEMLIVFGIFGLLAALAGVFVYGSILANRGEPSWRAKLMITGSSMSVIGLVGYMLGFWMMMTAVTTMYTSTSSGMTTVEPDIYPVVMSGAIIALVGGVIVFGVGFVSYCARAGGATKRVQELEVIIGDLHQRLSE